MQQTGIALILFPNCKINLGLHITSKRPDGYHNLETIFYPVPLTDALEVLQAKSNTGHSPVHFTGSGLGIEGDPGANLCVKAYHLLKNDFPRLPAVQMHLHKAIPMGAGLGGGSSDGAFTLLLLNQKFRLGISQQQLLQYALQLGSDCPFFILNKPCIGLGRGEQLQPVALDLAGYQLVLVNPGIHISTREAFGAITPKHPALPVQSLWQLPVQQWEHSIVNDFETGVFGLHPVLATIKQALYKAGAVYASMSGSGSTLYGLFREPSPQLPAFPANYFVASVRL